MLSGLLMQKALAVNTFGTWPGQSHAFSHIAICPNALCEGPGGRHEGVRLCCLIFCNWFKGTQRWLSVLAEAQLLL